MKVVIKDLKSGTLTTVYDGELSIINPVSLRRLGMGQTPAANLSANTNYRLYITPSVDITVPFIDIMHLSLPIDGKTVFSPQYYSETDISDAQINCNDQQNTIKPESGYTLAGNFLSSALATQNKFNVAYAVTPHIALEKHMSYTLDVKTAGRYQIQVDAGTFAKTYTDNEILEISVDGVTQAAKYTRTDMKVQRLTGPTVYLTEGTHTLKLENIAGGKAGYYIHQILFTPVKSVYVTLNGNKAAVSADFIDNFSGIAMITLYDADKKLVGFAHKTLSSESKVSAEVQASKTPVSAKVLIWNNSTAISPLTENFEISRTEDGWTE